MSFILDALRKAETKNRSRHAIKVPTGPEVLMDEVPKAPVASRWPTYLGIAALLALAGLLIFFLWPNPQTQSTTQTINSAQPASSSIQAPAENSAANTSADIPEPIAVEATTQSVSAELRDTGARSLDREVRRAQPQPIPRANSTPTPTATTGGTVTYENAPATTAQPQQRQSQVEIEQLPDYLTAAASGNVSLPPLHVDMHVYSAQESKRFIFVNLKKYHQGAKIDGDTSVEEITPTGAIIDHKGFRFVIKPN